MIKSKSITKAVVLCAGLGTRFLPITKSIPKEMLPVLNKPLIQIIVEQLKDAGIKDVLLVVGRNKESIVNHFDRNIEIENRVGNNPDYLSSNNIIEISYKRQGLPKGTGDALKKAQTFCSGKPFLMCYGDELFFSAHKNVFLQVIDEYKRTQKNVISVQKVPKELVSRYGIVKTAKYGNSLLVDDFIEKPKIENAPSCLAYTGLSVFDKNIFDALKTVCEINGEIRLTDAFYELIAEKQLIAKQIECDRFDVGDKLGLIKANIFAGLNDGQIRKELQEYISQLKY